MVFSNQLVWYYSGTLRPSNDLQNSSYGKILVLLPTSSSIVMDSVYVWDLASYLLTFQYREDALPRYLQHCHNPHSCYLAISVPFVLSLICDLFVGKLSKIICLLPMLFFIVSTKHTFYPTVNVRWSQLSWPHTPTRPTPLHPCNINYCVEANKVLCIYVFCLLLVCEQYWHRFRIIIF